MDLSSFPVKMLLWNHDSLCKHVVCTNVCILLHRCCFPSFNNSLSPLLSFSLCVVLYFWHRALQMLPNHSQWSVLCYSRLSHQNVLLGS